MKKILLVKIDVETGGMRLPEFTIKEETKGLYKTEHKQFRKSEENKVTYDWTFHHYKCFSTTLSIEEMIEK